jgi:RNA polymerase sigma-70 factor (ECF subfamily)
VPGDLRSEIEKHRAYLLRYASLQLRSPEAAEDAVQETLLAALAGGSGFAGRSNLRTWLTGILKHKIVDAIRRSSREQPLEPGETGDEMGEFDALFKDNGHWVERPAAWDEPDSALEQKQFLVALEKCLEGLPKRTARAFLMREHMGCGTEEICQELGVTSTHCWVLLYRARMALRQCLEQSWFGSRPGRRPRT